MDRKRYFAIIIFVVLGLFMFTFANPANDEATESKGDPTATNDNSNDKEVQKSEGNTNLNQPNGGNNNQNNGGNNNQNNGGNNNQNNGGNNNQNNGGNNNQNNGGNNNQNNGGNNNQNNGGNNNQNNGGNNNQNNGGNNNQNNGGNNYQPNGENNYQPNGGNNYQPNGDNNNQPSGDNNNQPSGDNNNQPSGDNNNQPSGDNNNQPSGDNNNSDEKPVVVDPEDEFDLEAYKKEVIDDLDAYKKEDEDYVPEIKDIKKDAIDAINDEKVTTKEEIDSIADKAKEDIDTAIANKKFTVKFYGLKGKLLSNAQVAYKATAQKPTINTNKFKDWNGSIELQFEKWTVSDDELNSVKGDLEVHARYKVYSATTKISILKEGLKDKQGNTIDYSENINDFNHPFNVGSNNTYLQLTITKEIEDAINNYSGSHLFVYFSGDNHIATVTDSREKIDGIIREVVSGEPDVYNDNQYKKIQYYVLKLQGDRFHTDGRVLYDNNSELAAEKEKALEEIKNYKKDDEKYIKEVTTEKEKIKNNINDAGTVEDVKKALEDGKKSIDNIINNKKFTVTFVGKNNLTSEVQVGYKKAATAPTSAKFTAPVYKDVTYKLTGWDKDFSSVTGDLTVNGTYEITKAVARVYVLADGYEIPSNRLTNYPSAAYIRILSNVQVELVLTKEILDNIKSEEYNVVASTDKEIRALVKNNTVLPTKDGKYKTYEFYSLKFCTSGFHIDGYIHYDKDAEALDNAKDKLNKLIKEAEAMDKTGKTDASVSKLNSDIKTAKEVVKGNDIKAINKSIEDLSNINLVSIVGTVKVVNNKKNYVQGKDTKFDLTVYYSDNNGNDNKKVTDYKVDEMNTTVGKHSANVTYNGFKGSFDYEVIEDASSNAEYNKAVKAIKEMKVKFKKEEFELSKIDGSVNITAAYRKGVKTSNYNATVTKKGNNKFAVSKKDFEKLTDKKTSDYDEYIYVQFEYKGFKITARYSVKTAPGTIQFVDVLK